MVFCDITFYLDKNQQFDVCFIHLTYGLICLFQYGSDNPSNKSFIPLVSIRLMIITNPQLKS